MGKAAREATPYDPKAVEAKWYDFWDREGYFRPRGEEGGRAFCITIPPPNVTGELHVGHALQHAIHDAVVRWRRMQGYRTLCLPGTDHAGIATQMKVEQQVYEETGKGRHDLGRDAVLDLIWRWREEYGGTILRQLRELGCSYDWPRERFTMDEPYARAVLTAFVRFYEKGWIYRGKRMVNWCVNCGTVISDLEVEDRDAEGHLWHIRYPGVEGGPDVVVATTRPETMLGDTGVAVHPQDPRWQAAAGGKVRLPLMDREIPIVADSYADPEMGSGAVKVTPAHDPNDYEVGLRHGLPEIQVIGFDGKMTEDAGPYSGEGVATCRKAVLKALEREGLLVGVEDHTHAVPHHDKCGTVIEPLPMEQWFVAMRDLAQQALPALRDGGVAYVPDRFSGYTVEWLENIQDWCISRQIWWGHRIPVWECEACGQVSVQVDVPERCGSCGDARLTQDPDVLDTWFSSALWPFATLGWPDDTDDLRRYHPTDLMITGRDILYLWIVRMVMTSLEFVGEVPFKAVLVHPTVQTRDGRRMSKSLGTGIDPRELIERYGADATRLSLLYQCGSSQDIRFDAEVVDNHLQDSPITETCRNFCNKVWNAARFVEMNLADRDLTDPGLLALPDPVADLSDRWILSQYHRTIQSVTEALEAYRFDEASRSLYEFAWNAYCDWYLEMAKVRLGDAGEARGRSDVQSILAHISEGILRLLHPMVPFVTEELWQRLPHEGEVLIAAPWPEAEASWIDESAEKDMELVQQVVGAVRNIRGTMRVPPGRLADVHISVESAQAREVLRRAAPYVRSLARVSDLKVGPGLRRPKASAAAVLTELEVYVPLAGLIDVEAEAARLEKEADKMAGALDRLVAKLANGGFLANAPSAIIEQEQQREKELRQTLSRVRENIASLDH